MSDIERWEEVKEEIRHRLDFVNLVEDYVRLEQRGDSYWGLCPFHAEKTPSFCVTPSMGIFKCFGCGEGGDIFEFFMKIENCDFMDALEMMARRASVELPDAEKSDGKDSLRSKLIEINEYALDCYRRAFKNEPGEKARRYLEERGFNEETIEKFKIGYAPPGWDNLLRALKRDGYKPELALKGGLLGKSKSGKLYDKFRDRIIFPIFSPSDRVLAFGGRVLPGADDEAPKYLNSPETPVFSKRRLLYALGEARGAARKSDRCLVMEGYTDVMKCHQEGFEEAVASLGTSLTENHMEVLRRYVSKLILVYDGDEAGMKAAIRGGKIGIKNGLEVSVVLLPDGKDPADILADTGESFSRYLDESKPLVQILVDKIDRDRGLDTVEGKEKVLQEVVPLVNHLPGRIKKQESIRWLSDRLGVDEQLIYSSLRQSSAGRGSSLGKRIKNQTGQNVEEIFFRSLAASPDKFQEAMEKISKKDFQDKYSKVLMKALIEIKNGDREFTPQNWLDTIPGEYKSYLAELLTHDDRFKFAAGIDPVGIADMVRNVSVRRERQRLARELSREGESRPTGDLNEAEKALLKQAMEMKKQEEKNIELDT